MKKNKTPKLGFTSLRVCFRHQTLLLNALQVLGAYQFLQFPWTGVYSGDVSVGFPLVFLRKNPMSCGMMRSNRKGKAFFPSLPRQQSGPSTLGYEEGAAVSRGRAGGGKRGPWSSTASRSSLQPSTSHCLSLGGAVTHLLRMMGSVRARMSCVRMQGTRSCLSSLSPQHPVCKP